MGSGYGSVSRTVEEIILAFDHTYKTIKETSKFLTSLIKDSSGKLTKDERTTVLAYIATILSNIDNAISRLSKAELLPEV